MTQRASESLVAVLIRIGLLLALAILLMAENAQAQALPAGFSTSRSVPTRLTSPQQQNADGARCNPTA